MKLPKTSSGLAVKSCSSEILNISAHEICQVNNCSTKVQKEKNQMLIELLEQNKISIPKNLY